MQALVDRMHVPYPAANALSLSVHLSGGAALPAEN
jgi:hypothetical protein